MDSFRSSPLSASPPPEHPFWLGTAVFFGKAILYLIAKTSKMSHDVHPEAQKIITEKQPRIYAFWHRYQLLLAYDNRLSGVHVLVSQSRDGELIARVLESLGFRCVRGSSSRGGAAALRQILDVAAAGGSLAFTPDGPRGPYRSVAPGLVAAAQKSGLPIIPCSWAGKRVKTLASWDKFLVPLPFGRYHFVYGEPLRLAPSEPDSEGKIRRALDAAASAAEAFFEGKN